MRMNYTENYNLVKYFFVILLWYSNDGELWKMKIEEDEIGYGRRRENESIE